MKVNMNSGSSNIVKYLAFISILIAIIITYNYIDLTHQNSFLRASYEENLKKLEAIKSMKIDSLKSKQDDDLKILSFKLEESSKNVESLRKRLVL